MNSPLTFSRSVRASTVDRRTTRAATLSTTDHRIIEDKLPERYETITRNSRYHFSSTPLEAFVLSPSKHASIGVLRINKVPLGRAPRYRRCLDSPGKPNKKQLCINASVFYICPVTEFPERIRAPRVDLRGHEECTIKTFAARTCTCRIGIDNVFGYIVTSKIKNKNCIVIVKL